MNYNVEVGILHYANLLHHAVASRARMAEAEHWCPGQNTVESPGMNFVPSLPRVGYETHLELSSVVGIPRTCLHIAQPLPVAPNNMNLCVTDLEANCKLLLRDRIGLFSKVSLSSISEPTVLNNTSWYLIA